MRLTIPGPHQHQQHASRYCKAHPRSCSQLPGLPLGLSCGQRLHQRGRHLVHAAAPVPWQPRSLRAIGDVRYELCSEQAVGTPACNPRAPGHGYAKGTSCRHTAWPCKTWLNSPGLVSGRSGTRSPPLDNG